MVADSPPQYGCRNRTIQQSLTDNRILSAINLTREDTGTVHYNYAYIYNYITIMQCATAGR